MLLFSDSVLYWAANATRFERIQQNEKVTALQWDWVGNDKYAVKLKLKLFSDQ